MLTLFVFVSVEGGFLVALMIFHFDFYRLLCCHVCGFCLCVFQSLALFLSILLTNDVNWLHFPLIPLALWNSRRWCYSRLRFRYVNYVLNATVVVDSCLCLSVSLWMNVIVITLGMFAESESWHHVTSSNFFEHHLGMSNMTRNRMLIMFVFLATVLRCSVKCDKLISSFRIAIYFAFWKYLLNVFFVFSRLNLQL